MSELERDEQRTGDSLRDISRWLATPAASGLYLSVRDLDRVGRNAGIPAISGRSRRLAVEHLFQEAAMGERVDALVAALIGEAEGHIRAYRDCDSDALASWESLAVATVAKLSDMRNALAS